MSNLITTVAHEKATFEIELFGYYVEEGCVISASNPISNKYIVHKRVASEGWKRAVTH